MLGLCFCARAFSICGEQGPLFIAVRRPLTVAASLVAEHRLQTCRLSSCGSRAQLLCGMWDLPRPGLEPVSPALAGRFSTTALPGKPSTGFSIFTKLCNHHHYLILEYFYHRKRNPIPISSHSPPLSWKSTFHLYGFAYSGYFIKWNHIEAGGRWAPPGLAIGVHSLWTETPKYQQQDDWERRLGPAQIKDKRPHISHSWSQGDLPD